MKKKDTLMLLQKKKKDNQNRPKAVCKDSDSKRCLQGFRFEISPHRDRKWQPAAPSS